MVAQVLRRSKSQWGDGSDVVGVRIHDLGGSAFGGPGDVTAPPADRPTRHRAGRQYRAEVRPRPAVEGAKRVGPATCRCWEHRTRHNVDRHQSACCFGRYRPVLCTSPCLAVVLRHWGSSLDCVPRRCVRHGAYGFGRR